MPAEKGCPELKAAAASVLGLRPLGKSWQKNNHTDLGKKAFPLLAGYPSTLE